MCGVVRWKREQNNEMASRLWLRGGGPMRESTCSWSLSCRGVSTGVPIGETTSTAPKTESHNRLRWVRGITGLIIALKLYAFFSGWLHFPTVFFFPSNTGWVSGYPYKVPLISYSKRQQPYLHVVYDSMSTIR